MNNFTIAGTDLSIASGKVYYGSVWTLTNPGSQVELGSSQPALVDRVLHC